MLRVMHSDHELPTVCILAGGLGRRLGDRTLNTPKALIDVAGQPFLLHQLRLLSQAGARRVVLCVAHLADQIRDVIGEERFGLDISYSYDTPELNGTLGAIRQALPLLGERFLTLYGDTYLRVDYRAFDLSWLSSALPAGMVVLRNRDQWGKSNAVFDAGLVTTFDKYVRTADMQWIDYGLGGLTLQALDEVHSENPDLADLHRVLAARKYLYGYEVTDRFYEIGTPAALRETDELLSSLPPLSEA
jgi:MurNAc alpha-1-phosphate uridylyltransferase